MALLKRHRFRLWVRPPWSEFNLLSDFATIDHWDSTQKQPIYASTKTAVKLCHQIRIISVHPLVVERSIPDPYLSALNDAPREASKRTG
jgi:hypothetical protein